MNNANISAVVGGVVADVDVNVVGGSDGDEAVVVVGVEGVAVVVVAGGASVHLISSNT